MVKTFKPQAVGMRRNAILYEDDSEIGYRAVSNSRSIINTGNGETHLWTDENGYRINRADTMAQSWESYDLKLLAIGDSYIQATTVENEASVSNLITEMIGAEYLLNVCTVNAGVAGYDPNHYYLATRKALMDRDYDLGLVFFYTGNDFISEFDTTVYLFSERGGAGRHPRESSPGSLFASMKNFIKRQIVENSHLYMYIQDTLYGYLPGLGYTNRAIPDVFWVENRDFDKWEINAQICLSIAEKFKKYEIPVVYILIPTVFQCNTKFFDNHIQSSNISPAAVDLYQPNRILAEKLAERNLLLIDPLESLQEKEEAGIVVNGMIDRHLNEAGHRVLAEFIYPTIVDQLGLKEGNSNMITSEEDNRE
ncbi:hypothetical protein KJ564_05250 [bacterium]|nr:hypothetical protein [bacterium]